jgi:nucleoside-diphosphate-sugar epimerase
MPDAVLIGYDMGYFANRLTDATTLPEHLVDKQYFADVRNISKEVLTDNKIDAVVHLAAISNDPMGNTYEEVTMDVNYRSSVKLAKLAKEVGAKRYVFASSCSMYGSADSKPKTEIDTLNPLTAYARSKVATEEELSQIAGGKLKVTSLRFSTACGMSERLRLDLVLNDFVAWAVASQKITILSDGTPWRPLINVKDMALAIEWALVRDEAIGDYLAVNVGSDQWNYQVKELADAVADVLPGVEVSVNKSAEPDKRSYQVSFEKFKQLAPQHQPRYDLAMSIRDLHQGLQNMHFNDPDFRNSHFMRLKVLTGLREKNLLTPNLEWAAKSST